VAAPIEDGSLKEAQAINRTVTDATAVDPAHGQAERLAADHVGGLRLTRVQDFSHREPRVRDEGSEQRAVRLVTAGSFGGANQIKFPTKPSGSQKVVPSNAY
jgi:hypothetical protein